MAAQSRVRVLGPLASYAGGFSGELARLGYTPLSARLQLQLMAHLSRWLASERLDAGALTPAVLERFLAARRAAGYPNHRTAKALEPLLGYLRGRGAAPVLPAAAAATPVEALLELYRRYLTVERGLSAGTARGYVDVVRPFLVGQVSADGIGLAQLTAADVRRRLVIYQARAAGACPSLAEKKITPHVLRHTAAMRLLHAGVDTSVIALWLGHEAVETTQIYLHADFALKERALARTTPPTSTPGRYRPPDSVLAFLESL